MADDPRDVRYPKVPPTKVARMIGRDRDDAVPRPVKPEPSRPVPRTTDEAIVQLTDRVRTISKDLHDNTRDTAILQEKMNTLHVEQRTTCERVELLSADVNELARQSAGQTAELKVLNGLLAKQLDANNAERTAANDHRRKQVEKIVAAVLAVILALQLFYLGSK